MINIELLLLLNVIDPDIDDCYRVIVIDSGIDDSYPVIIIECY